MHSACMFRSRGVKHARNRTTGTDRQGSVVGMRMEECTAFWIAFFVPLALFVGVAAASPVGALESLLHHTHAPRSRSERHVTHRQPFSRLTNPSRISGKQHEGLVNRIPATLQFTCQQGIPLNILTLDDQEPESVRVVGQCLWVDGASIPCDASRAKKRVRIKADAESCRSMCARYEKCLSFVTNHRGECFLRRERLGSPSAAVDETVGCAKLEGFAADWRAKHWPISGNYRLADIVRCSTIPGLAFYCGGLDAVNVRRLWPGSLANDYMALVGKRRARPTIDDAHVHLAKIIKARHEAGGGGCPEPWPALSACVLHVRLGDIFRDCSGASNRDCTNHGAAELWRGGPGIGVFANTKFIQPRGYFERVLDAMPTNTSSVVIVGSHLNVTREQEYLRLLTTLFVSRGLLVRWRLSSNPSGSHHQVDCDVQFMSAASCFIPSGGGFSNMVANLVRHRAGMVVRGRAGTATGA